jgi:hypothetical protein
MGRGRAKAKQTKVARQLKYSTGGTDLDRLQAELAGSAGSDPFAISSAQDEDDAEEDDDPYAAYADDDEDDEDEDADSDSYADNR